MARIAAAARFVQKPDAALGLVDPDLDQARRRDVAFLLAEVVGLPHAGDQRLVVRVQLSQHVERVYIVRVVVGDALQPSDILPIERSVVPPTLRRI
jgi:hypothetical protein